MKDTKSKEEKKSKSIEQTEITIERLLEISTALQMIIYNEEIPNNLAFRIGMFKLDTDNISKLYNDRVKKVNEKYRPYMTLDKKSGQRKLNSEKQKELVNELDALKEEKVSIGLRKFKLSDFEDITIPPAFYTLMKDLIEE